MSGIKTSLLTVSFDGCATSIAYRAVMTADEAHELVSAGAHSEFIKLMVHNDAGETVAIYIRSSTVVAIGPFADIE